MPMRIHFAWLRIYFLCNFLETLNRFIAEVSIQFVKDESLNHLTLSCLITYFKGKSRFNVIE